MAETINWAQDQPAPKFTIRTIRLNFPYARNLGIYVPRNVNGTSQPSSHAEGRALDVGLSAMDPSEKFLGDQLFQVLIQSALQSGIDNVIWNRTIWSRSQGGPRPFVGTYSNGAPKDPHTNHIHIEWTKPGSQMQRLDFLEQQINILRGGMEEIARYQHDIG